MPRDIFTHTVAKAEVDGTLRALGNVQVTVRKASDNSIATIYQARTGAAQGPSPLAGATGTNPFTTGATGTVVFWVDPGEYNIDIHDLTGPARITDLTLGFESVPAAVGGISGDWITSDGKVTYAMLAAMVQRQDVPLGSTIDWWRPSTSYDAGAGAGLAPPGFVVADGSIVTQANHDFGAIGSITLPDMRNAFVLGADITKGNGTAPTDSSDSTAHGPGINAVGGSNKRDLQHSHTVNAHSHPIPAEAPGTNATGDHTHQVSINSGGAITTASFLDIAAASGFGHYHGVKGPTGGASIGNHSHTVNSHSHGGNTSNSTAVPTGNGLSTTQDIKPRWVGLLQIMKVKRS